MRWSEVEKAFARAMKMSFSKAKITLAFPVLALCGILSVFCRAAAVNASQWVSMSLAFLPILLCCGLLLSLGVLLVRIHVHEVKGLHWNFRRLFTGSLDLILGTSYLSVPPILVYLLLWIMLGFFFLLQEIPGIGSFFAIVFSFGPFLLILSSLLLCFLNLALLFFVAPVAALQPMRKSSFIRRVLSSIESAPLGRAALFLLGLLPAAIVSALLSVSAMLTNVGLELEKSLSVGFEWFFIMIPFCALLTPSVIFFFNFAAESHLLLQQVSSTRP